MKDKTLDVVALGELLIDFTQNGLSEQGNPLFEANPGGAPCNVLAMLRKLGKRCAFVGKVGRDGFGRQLARVAEEAGIGLQGLRYDPDVHTTLAIVQTLPGGDRDFSFYRKPGADANLTVEDLDQELIQSCRIFHFGTLSLTGQPCRAATQKAVALAREAGALISFDPNLREPLWDSLEEAREQIAWGLARCDILKIADNELLFMTGQSDFEKGRGHPAKAVPQHPADERPPPGAQGSYSFCGGCAHLPARLHFGRRQRDHRGRGYLLRQRAELCAGAWHRGPDPAGPRPDAPLCQRRGLSGHHQKGRHPLDARTRTGGGDHGQSLSEPVILRDRTVPIKEEKQGTGIRCPGWGGMPFPVVFGRDGAFQDVWSGGSGATVLTIWVRDQRS